MIIPRYTCWGTLPAIAFVLTGILAAEETRFSEKILPILAENCFHCHGPDTENREADLRLDEENAAKNSVIVAGQPDQSPLYKRLITDDQLSRMPPPESGKSLSAEQIQLIKKWIQEGAPYEGHWAYEPIRMPPLPPEHALAQNGIDRFILNRLETSQLTLSPKAQKYQLIRRATFDLIGLPPTWDEVQNFVNDDSEDAFAKVIDRLLASPHYGERWGRHWLDIARYADTEGGAAIGFKRFPFSYTYRDYVIESLNADKPYDQFLIEQIAADQLGLPENDPALAGLGFLTVGMQFRNPHDTIDDQIDVVTRGLLGLTVACARCHDHKYDPITASDYYSLYATFASSEPPQLLPTIGEPPQTPAYQNYQSRLKSLQTEYEDMERDQGEVMRGRIRMQVGLYLKELAKGVPEQDLSSVFLSYRTDDLRPRILERWRKYINQFDSQDPVFGFWHQLRVLKEDKFADNAMVILNQMQEENGDRSKWAAPQTLGEKAPRWNPLVLDALIEKSPQSLIEVAEVYGEVFGKINQEWLESLLAASLEAKPGQPVITDQAPQHANINSAVHRQLRRHLFQPGTPTALDASASSRELNRTVRDHLRGMGNAIENLHLSSPGSPPRAMTLTEKTEPEEFYVFKRGNPVDRGETVQPRFLSVLSDSSPVPFQDGQRRRGLAQAITSAENPLVRRVVVNWVWRHHFGKGLVRSPDNFGTRGEQATHPKLLDYLAATFAEDGWSLKSLHRRIMLSATYQQSAVENPQARKLDPDNRLLWRMPRMRLDLEAMRDSMLAVSGELDRSKGGRPFHFLAKPVIPRRSVYAFINRDIVHPFASTFDGADPNTCTAKRPQTTVPQQTLFSLNSDFIQDRAAKLAAHPNIVSITDSEQRIVQLYRRVYSRSPDPQELELTIEYLTSASEADRSGNWQRLAHILLAANEFVFVD